MRATTARERLSPAFWLLTLSAILVVSAGIGLRDPWPPDEPRFALVAKEMVETGQWLFPHRNGELYPDKPPLYMWLIAAAYTMTGSLRIAFLLPSLAAALGTFFLVVDLGTRWWNRRVGLFAGALLLMCFQFTWQARSAQIDTTLCFWTTLGFYGLTRHLINGPAWGWYFISWAAMGAGVITKGVGFLPLFSLIPYGICRWRSGSAMRPTASTIFRSLSGPLIMVAVIAAWVIPMWLAVSASGDPALLAYRNNILFKQTGERYASAWHHHQAFWYYVANAPLQWLPLTLLVPWTLPAWWRRLLRGDPRQTMLLGWIAAIVIFFSLSPGKREVYLTPATPALALAFAPLMPGLLKRRDVRWSGYALLIVLLISLAAASLAGSMLPAAWLNKLRDRGIEYASIAVFAGILAVICAMWCVAYRRSKSLVALAGFLACGWFMFGWMGYPILNRVNSPADFMRQIQSDIGNAELGMVRYKEQYALQAIRPLTTFGYGRKNISEEVDDALRWLGSALAPQKRCLLIPDNLLPAGIDSGFCRVVGQRHETRWILIDGAAVDASGLVRPPTVR